LIPFPFQYTLGDGGDGGVVSLLDVLEEMGEAFVVVVYFRGIVGVRWRWREISAHLRQDPVKIEEGA